MRTLRFSNDSGFGPHPHSRDLPFRSPPSGLVQGALPVCEPNVLDAQAQRSPHDSKAPSDGSHSLKLEFSKTFRLRFLRDLAFLVSFLDGEVGLQGAHAWTFLQVASCCSGVVQTLCCECYGFLAAFQAGV
jgi:hypothetical protein